MSDYTVVLYFVGYAVFLGITLYCIVGQLVLKAAAVGAYFFLASSVYFSVDSFKGWPSVETIREEVQVVWIDVDERDTVDESSIYVWTRKKPNDDPRVWYDPRHALEYFGELREPRAYRMPFTKEGAKFAKRAQRAIASGQKVMLEGEPEAGSSVPGAGKKAVRGDGGGGFTLGFDGITGKILNAFEVLRK